MDPMTPAAADDPIDTLAEAPAAAETLGLAATVPPRPGLRGEVLSAAVASRPPGRPVAPAEVISPSEALRRTLLELVALVESLTAGDATRPAIEGWSVAGLLGHLGAIEAYFGAVLGWWPQEGPIEDEHDHLAATLPAVLEAEVMPFDQLRGRWVEQVSRVVARLDSLASREAERVRFHGFDFSVRSLLIVRTFEVWTHTEDICRAIGRPVLELDTSRLRLMTDAAVAALPIGMLLTGQAHRGRSVRIVLEGDGGGAWVQALELGAAPGEPEVTLVADAVDFCRVAARRMSPAALRCTVLGDAALATAVMHAAAVFAA